MIEKRVKTLESKVRRLRKEADLAAAAHWVRGSSSGWHNNHDAALVIELQEAEEELRLLREEG